MSQHPTYKLISLLILLSIAVQPMTPALAQEPRPAIAATPAIPEPDAANGVLFRTTVTVDSPSRRARLEALGVTLLTEAPGQAIVLATADQLEALARLRFEPRASDDLSALVPAHAQEQQWLATSLHPLLAQIEAVQRQRALAQVAGADAGPAAEAVASLHMAVKALSLEQMAGIAALTSVDDDGDGLTNTQEAWWCTDPLDDDTDDDGAKDSAEIQALKDWMRNRRAGPPGGTPWPSWPFNTTTCPDKDHDSIPNLAERWELGLNMDLESSDHDKFDDGQELFGVTYCPGGDASCGYGDLPRSSDSGYVGAVMPAWVKAPGKHPLVAAFPVPEVDVVESSLHVQAVTTVTTDHVIASGTEKSYSTAKTEGTSSSVTDTETWNEWQEVSRSVPGVVASSLTTASVEPNALNFGSLAGLVGGYVAGEMVSCAGQALVQHQDCWEVTAIKKGISWAQNMIVGPPQEIAVPSNGPAAIDWTTQQCRMPWNVIPSGSGYCTEGIHYPTEQEATERKSPTISSQERLPQVGGLQISQGGQPNKVAMQMSYPVGYPMLNPIPTTTTTKGSSRGGSQSTTHAQYEEHTVTNGEAFSSDESWGHATAQDSSHTADLWFTYKVRNTGTEYARQIKHLAFNIYIGDNPNPACTYHVGSTACGVPVDTVLFANFMPNEEHSYTSFRVPLTLEQMKTVDLGGSVRIVVEDFDYGPDELFYLDAVNAGVRIAIEDGTTDGDEAIDTYLIPTWGEEVVLDVLARYFPHTTDENGMLIAVWTPEYRADTPAWCAEPRVMGTGGQRTLWCKHALSTADWWNVYTNGMGDGSEGFQDTPASPGSVALFRFNQDSDLDGYSDRSELRLGTYPNDPASFPKPEMIAGVHSTRSGNNVVATLSLLNTGVYDAYGVEAVMIAPNDTISITNNTVGGSGRVRAQKQVIVGSRIAAQTPLPAAWLVAGHAQPTASGYYTGMADRTYTFTVQCADTGGCEVGKGSWSLAWNDGAGGNGTLPFGAGYTSPSLQAVGAAGVKVGLLSGKVNKDESFTVAATTPRDTLQYTIAAGHESDYTPPIVLVSYNDPQGNHRFGVPTAAMALASPTTDLMAFSGQMLPEPGVEIVTTGAAAAGANTTDLVVNNPTGATLTNAHLFMEFVNISGTVTSEVPVMTNLPPGPSVVLVDWSTASFSPAYDPTQDYIIMAFLTDYQGNILDTAARPLSSFQADPKPAFDMAITDETWDFGTAQQGTLLQRTFTLGSVGYMDLLTHLGTITGATVSGPTSRSLPPGDTATYTVTLNTQSLSVGPFAQEITVRTSDPERPEKKITIRGDMTAMPPDAPGGATLRPLDVAVTVTGNQGEWKDFTHNLGPQPETLHPVKVYSQDYSKLWGVGKYATPFGQGTASYDMFGDGRDGVMPSSGNLDNNNGVGVAIVNSGSASAYSVNVTDVYNGWRINPGDVVLIHQTQGTGAGCWETNKAASDYTGGTAAIQLTKPLQCNYASGGNNHAQIQRVPQYTDCPVSGAVTPLSGWNGSWGGIFAVMCSGTMAVGGTIVGSGNQGNVHEGGGYPTPHKYAPGGIGAGFKGGYGDSTTCCAIAAQGQQGESYLGSGGTSTSPNGNGGGGAYKSDSAGPTGGGGGNGTNGGEGLGGGAISGVAYGGLGGVAYGSSDLTVMTFGGGGGGGAKNGDYAGGGGAGGGIIFLAASNLTVDNNINANGGAGGATGVSDGGGGGGAGGSIFLRAQVANLGNNLLTAVGGVGGGAAGHGRYKGIGGNGRIRAEYCDTLSGYTNPPASPQKLDCYIVEQIETSPYGHARINLPETGTHTYQVQYGRRLIFGGAGTQTPSIRMPRQLYATASLDALVSNTSAPSGPLNLSLDIGNDATADWTYSNAATNFPATLNATGLASALNAYMVAQTGIAWGADVDVPVRVQIDRQADVILTNLVLTLQSNQPGALAAAAVEMGADRPLDVPVVITGNHTQGEAYDLTHALGPNAESIQPCKVYDQSGGTLKGVGKYCADFNAGTVSAQVFGNGQDGDLTVASNSNLNTRRASASGTAGSTTLAISNVTGGGFLSDQAVMIHQSRGGNPGVWEQNRILTASAGQLTLQSPLAHTYTTDSGAARAQVVWLPEYRNITINAGVTVSPAAWDGNTGGIAAFLSNGVVTINGTVSANGSQGALSNYGMDGLATIGGGFRGGKGFYPSYPAYPPNYSYGYTGEGDIGDSVLNGHSASNTPIAANGTGGGPGVGNGMESGPGGGGGNGQAGANGSGTGPGAPAYPGYGGSAGGAPDLTTMVFGGGGGSSANNNYPTDQRAHRRCASGGSGAGIVFVAAASIVNNGTISANGGAGVATSSTFEGNFVSSGAGAGGSILLKARDATLGTDRIRAIGGTTSTTIEGPNTSTGGVGGVGRIRVEYQNIAPGWSTVPPATAAQRQYYIADQSQPATTTRIYLPESFTSGRTYLAQYGRRYTFAAAGQVTSYLRVKRQVYSAAGLDALVSNTGVASGNLDLCLDIGADTTCDFRHNASTAFPATLNATSLANALNTYLLAQTGIAWGANVDVPVRVQVDQKADVMLTNLALTPVGAKTRFLRLPARIYDSVSLGIQFGATGTPAGPLAFTVDIGADGTVDFSYSGTPTSYPAVIAVGNAAVTDAFNAYLAPRSGDVDVPIRITPSPSLDTALTTFSAAPTARPDVRVGAGDISFSNPSPIETDVVTVAATIHNGGGLDSGPLTASFFATPPGGTAWYIGSDFVSNVPGNGGSEPATIDWNTRGFTGDVPVRVVVDPYNRVAETSETNNVATATVTIRTRPDLSIPSVSLSDPEPTAGETVTVTLTARNAGQTAAGASTLALYDGNPDSGGVPICQPTTSVAGGGQVAPTCAWTPTTPGLHRLFARADRDRQVNEYDEGNNDTWLDVYVGFRGPILVDSGGITQDFAYTTALGYGAVDAGQADESGSCGTEPWQTFRRDPGGRAVYRFDHLLPGHFYHLDLELYLCGQAARDETIFVDGNPVAGPEHLGDGQRHRLSLRLDPALYADRTISVTVETAGLGGALVNEINLYDVDYRYCDAGGANDPEYTVSLGYGYRNGVSRTQWGTLPFKSLRENQSGNTVSYRYDGLLPSKRYQAWLSFWQNTGSPVTEKVQINGVDTGTALTIQSGTPYSVTINVPTSYYVGGTITVSVVRTDATTSAMVNEIAVEERTLLTLPTIRDVRITNIGDTAASISWISADPADGQAHYGPTAALGAIGQDERIPPPVSRTHQVTLLNLAPETGYQFYVTSADSVGTAAGGAFYQFTTGPTLSLPESYMRYGQVFNPDNSPAAGALVYVTLRDADGLDSPGAAAPLSALVGADGYWSLNLGGARTADNQAPFIYDPATDRLDINATQGTGCAANQTIYPEHASPAPPMTLACPIQMTHSLAASWNLLGLTVRADPPTTAQAVCSEIAAQGGGLQEIERWWNGGWDAHVCGLPFNNFTLDLGRGYFLRASAAGGWTRTGTPSTSPLPVELYPGWNLVAFPKLTCSPLAEDVLVGIAAQGGACGEMDRWYAGNWQGHIKGLSFNNFAIAADQGYFVKCTQHSTYVPCQATSLNAVTAPPPAGAPAMTTPESHPAIRDVQVSNRRDVAFTVTWRTDRPSTGWIAYGAEGKLDGIAHDDRGAGTVATLHSVTVAGLAPETVYAFRAHSGESTADRGGVPYQVTTAAAVTPTLPLIAYGQLLDAAGKPVAGALVRAQIAGAAEPLSALTDGWGYWTLSLPLDDCAGQTLLMAALGPDGTIASASQPACDVQPAPPLTLRLREQKPIYLPLVVQ